MAQYKNDPRWIETRYPAKCAKCGRAIKKGERVFYAPATKTLLCNAAPCGQQASREFDAAAADENAYAAQF